MQQAVKERIGKVAGGDSTNQQIRVVVQFEIHRQRTTPLCGELVVMKKKPKHFKTTSTEKAKASARKSKKKRVPLEDFSQAAARIVREAIDGQ